MKRLLIFLSIFTVASCGYRKCETCEKNAFYKGLLPYLTWSSGDWTDTYLYIYFFQKDTRNYFTIRTDYDYPSYCIKNHENYDSLYRDQYMKMGDVDMFLITSCNDSLPTGLLGDCRKYFASRDSVPEFLPVTNDGSCFPMTFRYEFVNGKYRVEHVAMDIAYSITMR